MVDRRSFLKLLTTAIPALAAAPAFAKAEQHVIAADAIDDDTFVDELTTGEVDWEDIGKYPVYSGSSAVHVGRPAQLEVAGQQLMLLDISISYIQDIDTATLRDSRQVFRTGPRSVELDATVEYDRHAADVLRFGGSEPVPVRASFGDWNIITEGYIRNVDVMMCLSDVGRVRFKLDILPERAYWMATE